MSNHILYILYQNRNEIEASIAQRARKRHEQMQVLSRMDEVYERLEELHYEDRMTQRSIRYKSLRRGVVGSNLNTDRLVILVGYDCTANINVVPCCIKFLELY